MSSPRDNYLVVGGSGFLGRHIVEALLARGDTVSVLDIVQRYHDTPFYSADISDESQVSDAIRKVCVRFRSHDDIFLLILLLPERDNLYHPYGVPSSRLQEHCAVLEG